MADNTEQMNLRTDPATKDRIAERASKVGISRNEWMNRALKWALDQPVAERTAKERV